MNLETLTQRQEDLNYRLNDFTMQLRVVVDKIAGKENTEEGILKSEYKPNGLLDELQYLQEENKETLQEAERLLKRLSEATWQFEVKTGCTPVSNS